MSKHSAQLFSDNSENTILFFCAAMRSSAGTLDRPKLIAWLARLRTANRILGLIFGQYSFNQEGEVSMLSCR
jgi:hypothetical protein